MAIFEIGEPVVIAKLPKGVSEIQRPHFSVVQGLREGVRRRRQEICSAVNGNSISIYEVQSGRTVASYTVPSESRFLCPPYSIRRKTDEGNSIRRTYCVTERQSEIQVNLFEESVGNETAARASYSSYASVLEHGHIPIVHLEVLPHSEDILVVSEDGSLSVLSADLAQCKFTGRLELKHESPCIVATQCFSTLEASKSVLKSRPDLTVGRHGTLFVAAAMRIGARPQQDAQSLVYGVWVLQPATGQKLDLSLVLEHSLVGNISYTPTDRESAIFASKNTRLHYRSQSKVMTFDLTSVLPRQVSDLPLPPDNVSSLSLPDGLVLCSANENLTLLNSIFRSFQTTLDLARTKNKRKRGDNPTGPVQFVTYFPQLRRAVATRRNYLVAVDLLISNAEDAPSAFKASSTLINNVGRGHSRHDVTNKSTKKFEKTLLGNHLESRVSPEKWSSIQKQLERCASDGDVTMFEKICMEQIILTTEQGTLSSREVPEDIQNYLVSKIFQSTTDEESPVLKVAIHASETIRWLAHKGRLMPQLVQGVLSRGKKGSLQQITSVDICKAMIFSDESLTDLRYYVRVNPRFNSKDLCQIIHYLIKIALADPAPTTHEDAGALILAAGENDLSGPIVSSSHRRAIDMTPAVSASLVAVLNRCVEDSQPLIAAGLRFALDRQDLIALVQLLRQQLFRSGYTRSLHSQPYPSPPASDIENSNQKEMSEGGSELQLPLATIATVLSCCIDAIGSAAVVTADQGDQFIQTLILELSSEVSRTLESLDDATYLQGLLRETLRFSTSTQKNYPASLNPLPKARTQKPGTITTLYAEAGPGTSDASSAVLPLSLRSDTLISHKKLRKGGGQLVERSKREMGMMQDRLRGPYSLERLTL